MLLFHSNAARCVNMHSEITLVSIICMHRIQSRYTLMGVCARFVFYWFTLADKNLNMIHCARISQDSVLIMWIAYVIPKNTKFKNSQKCIWVKKFRKIMFSGIYDEYRTIHSGRHWPRNNRLHEHQRRKYYRSKPHRSSKSSKSRVFTILRCFVWSRKIAFLQKWPDAIIFFLIC